MVMALAPLLAESAPQLAAGGQQIVSAAAPPIITLIKWIGIILISLFAGYLGWNFIQGLLDGLVLKNANS